MMIKRVNIFGLAFLLVVVFGVFMTEAATNWRVGLDGDDSAGGTNWVTALQTVSNALSRATSGDQVWVKAGTYRPTSGTDRSQSFQMIDGLDWYGGFAGTETNLNQRDWENNVTILSGDIGVSGTHTDNSYHVVQAADARLDGFTIQDGYADVGTTVDIIGGGVTADDDNVTIADCTFSNNYAKGSGQLGGGGVNLVVDDASSVALISNCVFMANSNGIAAGGRGGALVVDGDTSPGTATVVDCDFIGNNSFAGGALYSYYAAPTISRCTFVSNTSVNVGGAFFLNSAKPQVSDSVFIGNSATAQAGGVMYGANNHLAGPP
jgi:hypothetical protein